MLQCRNLKSNHPGLNVMHERGTQERPQYALGKEHHILRARPDVQYFALFIMARASIRRYSCPSASKKKSMWTVVAILAILKAGGAFVLLNPKQPSIRIAI